MNHFCAYATIRDLTPTSNLSRAKSGYYSYPDLSHFLWQRSGFRGHARNLKGTNGISES